MAIVKPSDKYKKEKLVGISFSRDRQVVGLCADCGCPCCVRASVRSVARPCGYSNFGDKSLFGRCAFRALCAALQPETRSRLIVRVQWSDGRDREHLYLLRFWISLS